MSPRNPAPLSRRPRNPGRRRLGLSLVEVMISLSIAALLLTAAATAFNVSAAAVEDNNKFFRATQAARVSLHQILTNVRRGSVKLESGPHWVRLTTAPAPGETVGDDVTYEYRPEAKQLVLVTNDSTEDPDYVLASNVADMTFGVESGTDYNNDDCVANVTVTIRVKVDGNVVTLSGAAAPRRNLKYGVIPAT